MQTRDPLLAKIQTLYNDPHSHKVETVQALWSGYGEIARYFIPNLQQTCIAKHIHLQASDQHPRGWNTAFSHQRKLSSYHNEYAFYTQLSQLCTNSCRAPKILASGINNDTIWLIMEDLNEAGFTHRYNNIVKPSIGIITAKQCLNWLAHFHATFIQHELSAVWSMGTYWHLATRPDEWQNMPPSKLKDTAMEIDNRLTKTAFHTLLHGDAKLANFCFPAPSSTNNQPTLKSEQVACIAAVDFQYTGKGIGTKDVVYLLGSCFASADLFKHAEALIQYYFDVLNEQLSYTLESHQIAALEKEWRESIPFAWADFERFLRGWAPEHAKLHAYSETQTALALSYL